tara:strand:+ start:1242 stop:1475 length:234 start_codon:yes stop_codon:yes gene_type:complete
MKSKSKTLKSLREQIKNKQIPYRRDNSSDGIEQRGEGILNLIKERQYLRDMLNILVHYETLPTHYKAVLGEFLVNED